MRRPAFLAVAVAFAVVACRGNPPRHDDPPPTPEPRDLSLVCSGKPIKVALAYDDAKPKAHRIEVFAADEKSQPLESTPNALEAFRSVDPEQTELVGCVRRTKKKKESSCSIKGHPLDLESSTFELSVRVAKTAKILAETTVSYPAPACPTMFLFTGEHDAEYVRPDRDFEHLARPFVWPDGATDAPAADGKLSSIDADYAKVCDGLPEGRAPAYVAGKARAILFERVDPDPASALPIMKLSHGAFEPFKAKDHLYPLVVCAREHEGSRVKGKSCEFNSGTVDLYGATWDIEVREAKTAKLVGSTSSFATQPADACPDVHIFSGGDHDDEVTIPEAQLVGLGKLLAGDAK